MSATTTDLILSELELENILHSLKPSSLESVGNKEWVQQMSMLEELNIHTALQAQRQQEEWVRDALIENEKLPFILRELLLIELWREEVLPRILKLGEPESSFQSYMILFNEANLVNILETCLFHGPACQSMGEASIDLVDYCVRQLTEILSDNPSNGSLSSSCMSDSNVEQLRDWKPGMPLPDTPKENPREELQRHKKTTSFQLAMKSISLLQYLSDHLDDLPLGVSTRLMRTHDAPGILVKLLELKPWIRTCPGKADQVYEANEWQDITDDTQVQKLEGQTWMALYHLISKPTAFEKYDLSDYHKGVLLKLMQFFNDPLIEQLPFLSSLRKWLTELQMGSVPPAKASLLIESVAAIREQLVQKYSSEYGSIAKSQASLFLESQTENFDAEIRTLLQSFDSEAVCQLAFRKSSSSSSSRPRSGCVTCGRTGAKHRCSRCHKERYCGRNCQVEHWPQHKKKCQQWAEAQEAKVQEL